jgi:hypothetical protein
MCRPVTPDSGPESSAAGSAGLAKLLKPPFVPAGAAPVTHKTSCLGHLPIPGDPRVLVRAAADRTAHDSVSHCISTLLVESLCL